MPSGRERIALTMRRRPMMCPLSIGHYNLQGGFKPHQIWHEPEAAKRAFGIRLFFKGNINSVAQFHYRTREEDVSSAACTLLAGKPGASKPGRSNCSCLWQRKP